jgi:hypothetical protein
MIEQYWFSWNRSTPAEPLKWTHKMNMERVIVKRLRSNQPHQVSVAAVLPKPAMRWLGVC